jgi:hypothetical protein
VALKSLFKLFVLFLKEAGLISGNVIAVDGTKIRGNNSKKNNYNQKKIDRHLAYIEEKTKQYLAQLDKADREEDQSQSIAVTDVEEKLEKLKTHKIKYEQLAKQIEESKEQQVSTTDADARALLVRGVVVEVGYNVQAAVDAKHSLVVATHTINRNDKNALYDISSEAKENIAAEALRFAAWRRAGFLALKFIRSTNVEPCTNVSTKHETPPFAKPLLAVVVLFRRHFDSFRILNAPCPTMKNTIVPTIRSGYFEFVK